MRRLSPSISAMISSEPSCARKPAGRSIEVASEKQTTSNNARTKNGSVVDERMEISVERLAAEQRAGDCQEKRRIDQRIGNRNGIILPCDGRPVVDDQGAHIKYFKMRNGIIDSISDTAHRLVIPQRDFVQVPSHQENPKSQDERNRSIRG